MKQQYTSRSGYRYRKGKLEYNKYRVRTPVRSFRDLEVYKKTTQLAVELFKIKSPVKGKLVKEFDYLYEIAKHIPRLIAESYGNKFTNFNLSQAKLERSSELISDLVAKMDFLTASISNQSAKEKLLNAIKNYQRQRRKIINLKSAWARVFRQKL